jgi:PAS domain S-box-containing protein
MTLADATELKAKEYSFRLLFESNPVPTWLHSPRSLKFLAVNDAAVAHYGYSKEVFLGMSLLDIVPQDDRDTLKAAIRSNPHAKEGTGQHAHSTKSHSVVARTPGETCRTGTGHVLQDNPNFIPQVEPRARLAVHGQFRLAGSL